MLTYTGRTRRENLQYSLEALISDKMVRWSFSNKRTYAQSSEPGIGLRHAHSRGYSKCKSPEAGISLVCWKRHTEASVGEAE